MTEAPARGRPWWRKTLGERASGIFQIRTTVLPREEALRRSRKRFRPPLLFNLCLLLFGVLLGGVAVLHRRHLDARFEAMVAGSRAAPFEVQRIRRDLAALDLDEKALEQELAARLASLAAQGLEEFHLDCDTKSKKLVFRFGELVVREASLEVGPPRPVVSASGDRLPPTPLTGVFTVRQKLERPAWKPPAWLWVEAGLPVPSPLPSIPGALGRYVIVLTDDVVLHSPPPPDSALKGVRPGSLMAPERDLAAIWKRIGTDTRVNVF
jgi:hypothetical protein